MDFLKRGNLPQNSDACKDHLLPTNNKEYSSSGLNYPGSGSDLVDLDCIVATKTLLYLGYQREDVRRAYQICTRETNGPVDAKQILSEIHKFKQRGADIKAEVNDNPVGQTEADSFSEIESENLSLKEKMSCKHCGESQAQIAFLPCGHLATCSDCGPAMRYCILCKALVKATVKVYLS